jgi:hypothetical protein
MAAASAISLPVCQYLVEVTRVPVGWQNAEGKTALSVAEEEISDETAEVTAYLRLKLQDWLRDRTYFVEVARDRPDLRFQMPQSTPTPIVVMATLERLVQRLTYEKFPGKEKTEKRPSRALFFFFLADFSSLFFGVFFWWMNGNENQKPKKKKKNKKDIQMTKAFLLTFRFFSSPDAILEQLLKRYSFLPFFFFVFFFFPGFIDKRKSHFLSFFLFFFPFFFPSRVQIPRVHPRGCRSHRCIADDDDDAGRDPEVHTHPMSQRSDQVARLGFVGEGDGGADGEGGRVCGGGDEERYGHQREEAQVRRRGIFFFFFLFGKKPANETAKKS